MKKAELNNLNEIFHAYDIRGTVPDELNAELFYKLGKAFVKFLNAKKIVVGRDFRKSSLEFQKSFIKGASDNGCDVVDAGEIPTELIYFITGSDSSYDGGATITASHNPAGWNGCKFIRKNALAISKDSGLFEIKRLIEVDDISVEVSKKGVVTNQDFFPQYKDKILSLLEDINIPKLKIAVDAGNGIGGKVFEKIFGRFDLDLIKMYFDPDDAFPNHPADPLKAENVKDLKEMVLKEKCDLGIAIDGDADRVFFIDKLGRTPTGVFTGSIFAKNFLKENKGVEILYDPRVVFPTRDEIKNHGGNPTVC